MPENEEEKSFAAANGDSKMEELLKEDEQIKGDIERQRELEKKYGQPCSVEEAVKSAGLLDGLDLTQVEHKDQEVENYAKRQMDFLKQIKFSDYYHPLQAAALRLSSYGGETVYKTIEKVIDGQIKNSLPQKLMEHLDSIEAPVIKRVKDYEGLIGRLSEKMDKQNTSWIAGTEYLEQKIYPKIPALEKEIENLQNDRDKAIELGRADYAGAAGLKLREKQNELRKATDSYKRIGGRIKAARLQARIAEGLICRLDQRANRFRDYANHLAECRDHLRLNLDLKGIEVPNDLNLGSIDSLIKDTTNYVNAGYCELNGQIAIEPGLGSSPAVNILADESQQRYIENHYQQELKEIEQLRSELNNLRIKKAA